MKKISITLCALAATTILWAQQDSIFERSVMVERDFQPTVEKARKINSTPDILQAEVDATEPDFSTYNEPLEKAHNITPMGHVDMRFPTHLSKAARRCRKRWGCTLNWLKWR